MTKSLQRNAVFLYGSAVYLLFLGTFLYAIGFLANAVVPKSIDSGAAGPVGEALLGNTLLLSLFALQHTIMARAGFKRWWTRIIPPAAERSTFVLATCLTLVALYAFWRPLPGVVWSVDPPALRVALWTLCGAGWAFMVFSTCQIHHFDLFGMRQVWLHWRGRPYEALGFRTRGLYRFVRHPIQVGFLVAFWATPDMTAGHLLFAGVTTAYILIAVRFLEERDLVREFGETYRTYREHVAAYLPLRMLRSQSRWTTSGRARPAR